MNTSDGWKTEFTLRMARAAQLVEWGDLEAAIALLRGGRDNVLRELSGSESLRASMLQQYDELIVRFSLHSAVPQPDSGATSVG